MLNDSQRKLIAKARKILVIQAENPDGDSLGSALALEEIFSEMGKAVALHCPVQIPTYLRHVAGWDRVSADFPTDCDLAIIVDTSSQILLSKTLKNPVAKNWLSRNPVLVFDHHISVEPDLPFNCDYIISDTAVATGELIFDLATQENWKINASAATNLFISIQADSLGLTTQATTAQSFETCGKLVEFGVNPAEIEEKRREFMKKKPEILKYKGELISRIEYFNSGRTALIFVPFSEIQEYSNDYNPTMLVLDEMRLVIGVDVAIGVKTYPDGKLTGKLRTNIPVSHLVAKSFGGDGHPFAAGFRIFEKYEKFVPELVATLERIYREFDEENAEKSRNSDAKNFSENSQNSAKILGNFRIKKEK
jgi:phosphoesterase RecJ-like protein